jgi:mono/diheme cytochrome c family protein
MAKKLNHVVFTFLLLAFFQVSCKTGSGDGAQSDTGFETYKLPDEFELKLAASDPLIEAPVVIDFDNKGRIWVVEMKGYMPNLAGDGENAHNGRISILEDKDKDGLYEHATTFLDSLVLPRAIAHVYGGLLYAVPPNLYFVDIDNDKPGKTVLVDSMYSYGGNVESQPNGLMMGIDNWIYNANSNFRYRLKNGKWLKEPTAFRGQWGITKDNYGRLFYNSNEIQISGDYVLPGTLIRNPYMKPVAAIDRMLTTNQHVHPLHPTTVNRGSEKGILDKDSLLVNVTAACGPLVYRGDQFPSAYQLNAFVCEPEANVVKRNILTFGALQISAKQAWDDKEFIASTDEGFRPVNILDAPDGAMYVVDMHRGIMQHRAYATPYYRNGISQKKLDTLQNAGRILRVQAKNKPLDKIPDLTQSSASQLVELLKSPNGWIRDRAQELLIDKKQPSIVPQLDTMVLNGKDPVTPIHALYVLEGWDALSFDLLQKTAASSNPMLSAHALVLLQRYNSIDHVQQMETLVNSLMNRNDTVTNLYLAATLGPWAETSKKTFLPLLARLSGIYPGELVYQEAVVSSLKGLEEDFQQLLSQPSHGNKDTLITGLIAQTISNKKEKKMNSIFVDVTVPVDKRTAGLEIFQSTCSACHGADGEGKQNIAPPLKGSEYVEGPPTRLGMILLNGISGPISLKGQTYTFNGSMPNFANNYTDQQISDVIEYIRNSFIANPPKSIRINADKIKELRGKHSGPLSDKELQAMANGDIKK